MRITTTRGETPRNHAWLGSQPCKLVDSFISASSKRTGFSCILPAQPIFQYLGICEIRNSFGMRPTLLGEPASIWFMCMYMIDWLILSEHRNTVVAALWITLFSATSEPGYCELVELGWVKLATVIHIWEHNKYPVPLSSILATIKQMETLYKW